MAKEKKEDKPADEALHAEEAEQPAPMPTKPATFKGKLNKYGFIHLNKGLIESWGLTFKTEQAVTIEVTLGQLIIKKA